MFDVSPNHQTNPNGKHHTGHAEQQDWGRGNNTLVSYKLSGFQLNKHSIMNPTNKDPILIR